MMRLAYWWTSVAAAIAAATGGPALPFLAGPALAAPPPVVPQQSVPQQSETRQVAAQPAEPELTTWGVRPADTGHGTGRSNFEYAVEPGTTITDAFLVSNYNEVPLELDVYAVDAYTSRQGELAAALATESPDGAGGWIALERTQLVLPEGESMSVEFTLTVPEDAEPGDHSAAILTSLLAQDASGLSVDRRLGSRVHIRVAGEAAPALSIVDMSVETGYPANPFTDRPVRVSYTVVNTGNIRLAGDVDVSVRDLLGRNLGGGAPPERLAVPEILPGDRVDLVTELTEVGAPLLRLTVEVAIEPRPVPGPSPLPDTDPVTETRGVWVLPWLLLGAGAVLALGLIGWRYRRRHAQQRFEAGWRKRWRSRRRPPPRIRRRRPPPRIPGKAFKLRKVAGRFCRPASAGSRGRRRVSGAGSADPHLASAATPVPAPVRADARAETRRRRPPRAAAGSRPPRQPAASAGSCAGSPPPGS